MTLKERIIESASVLFFRNGIRSITMSDIAKELGISKRTLYEVFHDKEELLETCVAEHLSQTSKEIEEIIASSKNVIDVMMRIYAKYLKEMQGTNKSVIHDLKKYHSPVYKRIECKQHENMKSFLPFLQKGIEQGLIRKDVNVEITIWLLKSQFKALTEDNYIPTDQYSTEEIISTIILNFIRGITTPLGMEEIDKIMAELKIRN
jgi:AcrR family transcriptional regulator